MGAPVLNYPALRPIVKTPRLPERANIWDGVLAQEMALWHAMLPNWCAYPCRYSPDKLPWIVMPREGRTFRPVGTLPVSQVGLTDVPVLTERVPLGYDGVITEVICELTAAGQPTGLLDGSGDVTWRLSADGRFLRDYGDMTVTHGSLRFPGALPRRGVRVYSNNLIVFSVVFDAAAAAALNPAGMVVCSISGWYWPRR